MVLLANHYTCSDYRWKQSWLKPCPYDRRKYIVEHKNLNGVYYTCCHVPSTASPELAFVIRSITALIIMMVYPKSHISLNKTSMLHHTQSRSVAVRNPWCMIWFYFTQVNMKYLIIYYLHTISCIRISRQVNFLICKLYWSYLALLSYAQRWRFHIVSSSYTRYTL